MILIIELNLYGHIANDDNNDNDADGLNVLNNNDFDSHNDSNSNGDDDVDDNENRDHDENASATSAGDVKSLDFTKKVHRVLVMKMVFICTKIMNVMMPLMMVKMILLILMLMMLMFPIRFNVSIHRILCNENGFALWFQTMHCTDNKLATAGTESQPKQGQVKLHTCFDLCR